MIAETALSRRRALRLLLVALIAGALPSAAVAKAVKRKRRATNSGGSKGGSGGADRSFSSCKQARAAGYSRMRRGDPGYSAKLDRDGDGIACE